MIDFVRLYTITDEERSDIIFTLEQCKRDCEAEAARLDEIFIKSNAPKGTKNAFRERVEDLKKIITILGGIPYVKAKEEHRSAN